MDGKIVAIMKALQTYLVAQLPSLKTVEISPGVFDDDEVKRITTNANTLHLAFLGLNRIEMSPGGPLRTFASFGAYVAATGPNRVYLGLNMLEAVAIVLAGAGEGEDEGLGVDYIETPVIGSMENLYSKDNGKRGVAIAGLSFAIPVHIGKETFGRDLIEVDDILYLAGLDGTETEMVLDYDNDERVEPLDDES